MESHPKLRKDLDSIEPQLRARYKSLQDEVVGRARGIFLWVRVVVDLLLFEASNGAEISDLEELLSSLPLEVENLYATILRRTLPKYHEEAYLMLELVFRSPMPLDLQSFCGARQLCLTREGTTDLNSRESRLVPTSKRETIERRMQSRCGGLIEVVETSDGDGEGRYQVQLMHQSVKDFLGGTPFLENFLPERHPWREQNGYTFLFRYYLDIIRYSEPYSGLSEDERREANEHRLHALRAAAICGREAERSIKASLQPWLDKVEDRHFQKYLPCGWNGIRKKGLPYDPMEFPVDSRLAFAVVADLKLYVLNKKKETEKHSTKFQPLLSCVIEHQMNLLRHRDRRYSEIDFVRTEMLQRLCDCGVAKHLVYRGVTALGSLFGFHDPLSVISEEEYASAKVLLQQGLDPNTSLFPQKSYARPTKPNLTMTPLHVVVADAHTTELLLAHGADINAHDSEGLTPLDYLLFSRNSMEYQLKPAYDWALLVLEQGARITSHSLQQQGKGVTLDEFISELSRSYNSNDKIFELLRRAKVQAEPHELQQMKAADPNWLWRMKAAVPNWLRRTMPRRN